MIDASFVKLRVVIISLNIWNQLYFVVTLQLVIEKP
jgi:hypothetical protein